MMQPTTDELRTMARFHADMARIYSDQGARSKARAAKRRADSALHALRNRRAPA